MKKRVISVLVALVLLSSSLTAQNKEEISYPKNEISAGFGFVPVSSFVTHTGQLFSFLFTMGQVQTENISTMGAINLDYAYHVSPMVAIDANISYSNISFDEIANSINFQKHDNINLFNLMVGAKFDWIRKECYTFYSRIMAGATLANRTVKNFDSNEEATNANYTNVFPTGQVTLAGFEYGNMSLRGFAEIGFGQSGTLIIGVKYKF